MKKIVLLVLLCMSMFAFSQPKDHEMTILEKLYFAQQDSDHKIIQEKDNSRRELVLCKSKNENSFKKYILTEYGYENMVTGSAYIVSKDNIPNDQPLYDIQLGKQRVINLDKKDQPEDSKYHSKMTVKLREEHIDATDPFAKIVNKVDEGETTEICIDHWWVTYIVETGEVIEIEYLGSDCYTFGSGGGGGDGNGSNPAPENLDPCNLTCEQAENAANSLSGIENPEEVFSSSGPVTVGLSGRIRKPFNPKQTLVTLIFLDQYKPTYSSFFKGIVYKESVNETNWKWESCVYNYTAQDGGTIPPCCEITYTVNASTCVISPDELVVETVINFQFKINFTCILGSPQVGTYNGGGRIYRFYTHGTS